jgi:hypothetical protein
MVGTMNETIFLRALELGGLESSKDFAHTGKGGEGDRLYRRIGKFVDDMMLSVKTGRLSKH